MDRTTSARGPAPAPAGVRTALRVTLHDSGQDVAIDASAASTVADLASALAEHAGLPGAGTLFGDRLGRLRPEEALTRSGLRDGDLVSLAGPVPSRLPPALGSGAPVADLLVTGGPAAGHRVALAPGRYVVGRDPAADVTVADASLSRSHFAVVVAPDGVVAVGDAGSSNGTAVEGRGLAPGAVLPLAPGQTVEAGRSTFAAERWRAPDGSATRSAGARISFNRPPRVSRGYEPPTLRVDPPPSAVRAIRIPVVVAVVPVFMGVALFLITSSPIMLMMAAGSPIMMIGSTMGERRSSRRDHVRQLERFEASVAELETGLAAERRRELEERRVGTPHAAELVRRASDHLPELWERRPADRDYLDVRLGVADQPSIVGVSFAPGGDPALREGVDRLVREHQTVPVVPVHVRLTDVGAIGVVGDRAAADAIARWVLVQLATLQSPRDVVVTAAFSAERSASWRWLSWLPHVDHAASPLEGEHLAVGELAARELLRRVSAVAEERRAEDPHRRQRARRRTTIVLLVDEDVAPEAVAVDALLDGCAEIDVVAVWLARERRNLPGGCGVIVEASSERAVAGVTWTATGRVLPEVSVDALTPQVAESVARSLAPVEDTTAGGAAASVPRSVALVELLDLVDPTPERIARRWAARGGAALDAVVGAGASGAFSLDLRADGPHALVAGTTGAGKSELLQSLIASLAASHPPDRISFLLVDYKGGAAFKDCVGLPHSVGMVTDLDEHQVHRALVSLNAELKRRELLLAELGARDLMELERRDPAAAPPSLVIVVDEFATLAKEVPQFVAGVVDVAQRGRSLGVHLVLATQRPGNAVTENIRANTNLRLALRVAGVAESDDVIGAPDAARLPRSIPGRAYARTGPTELELFQAGFVGARTRAGGQARAVEVRELRPAGARLTTQGGTPIADPEQTDLQLLVAAIDGATSALAITRPASPWLPALGPAVALGALPGGAAIGLLDEPLRQRQVPLAIDLPRDGNLLVYGSGGSGKTTVLRTLAASLAADHAPAELHLYGLDFGGRGLQALEALPHCGSVVPGEDEERVARLLSRLRRTIDTRSRLFADRRVATLADFRARHPDEPMARIVVLLDSYAGFLEAYERVDLGALVEAVPRLVADGRAAGVHFAITGDRRAAVPSAVASLIATRIILRMANDEEYQVLGLKPDAFRGAVLPPGRGFLTDGRELQVATLAGTAEAPLEAAAHAALAERLAAATPERAPGVLPLPTAVAAAALPAAPTPLCATFGLDDLDLAPVTAVLGDAHFAVIGPYRSGRSTALDTIAAGLRAATPELTTHLLAPRRSWLPEADGWDTVARGAEQCEARIAVLLDELLGSAGDPDAAPVLVVIDDAGELVESPAASALDLLLRRGRDAHVRVLLALESAQARHYVAWVREVRKDGRGLLLDPNLDLDGDLLGVRLPRRSNPVLPPGRGYLVGDGRVGLVQVARRPRG